MAKLPDNSHTTLARIEQAVIDSAPDWRRPHLGASLIGRPCDRELWYGFRWAKAPEHSARLLRLFARGQREEDVFVDLLRAAGVEVHTRDAATGDQFRVSAHGGHFGGSMDGAAIGIVEAPRTWHVTEFKTSSDKLFKVLVKDGVEKAKPEHFAQMQVYMHLAGLTRAYYLTVNKNDDSLYAERVRYDGATAERLIERAERIIFAQTPPPRISDDPAWWQCKFCDFYSLCHEQQPPPAVSCRTCLHATPERDGRWTCAHWGFDIDTETQKKGCEEHRLIPALVPYASVVDASEAENWVEYETANGYRFRNGARGSASFTSRELGALPPALMGDPEIETIRERFGAEVCDATA